jgi:SMC interacting uncharacterized protein involved in chromosome segregation
VPSEAADGTALLHRHGLHVTAQRLAVLRAVSRVSHQTADDIDQIVRVELGAISRQSVYDNLGTLAGRGLLRRIQPAGSPARYEIRVGTTIITSSAVRAGARSMSIAPWVRSRASAPTTTPASRSTKPRSSIGVDARIVPQRQFEQQPSTQLSMHSNHK